jgi:mono/diheme cytochrome c family protein
MKKVFHSLIVSVFLFLPTYGYGQMGMMEGMMNMSMIRHHFVMQNGVDPNYVSKVNPLKRNAANIVAGKKLYEKSCALCHGTKGLGDGEGGKGLKPPPANIAMFIKMHNVPDGYLFWTIAEGGIPLQTAMPPFKNVMREDEIWKTIIFLREL